MGNPVAQLAVLLRLSLKIVATILICRFLISGTEAQSSCDSNQFRCPNGNCKPRSYMCDGDNDCEDFSDERNCPICKKSLFRCSNRNCVSRSTVCDGSNTCLDNSDETNCAPCNSLQVSCSNRYCVSPSSICDGNNDCLDNSDETNCAPCKGLQVSCLNRYCISPSSVCDGNNNCLDRSDERNCSSCRNGAFRCSNRNCIPRSSVCDGNNDCLDDGDERNCSSCRSGAFKCSNRNCIPRSSVCDGKNDCLDHGDERNCTSCKGSQFTCSNRNCISSSSVCDGNDDCLDLSDETNCSSAQCSSRSLFYCSSQQCIPQAKVCDFKRDCSDGSDEFKFNCPGEPTPNKWTEFWHASGNKQFSLIGLDDNVALYWAENALDNFTWLFRLLSSAWKHVKNNYGPIGGEATSSFLYVVLHPNKNNAECLSHTSLSLASGFRNLIDCSLPTSYVSSATFQSIVSNFGEIIRGGANGILNEADKDICGDTMKDIITYDIYFKSQGASADVMSWRGKKLNETFNGKFCFRDWFIQIYESNVDGGVQFLTTFYNLTKSYWPKRQPLNGNKLMNLGEFVHFWSEATGTDLQLLAFKAFTWNVTSNQQLTRARESYQFNDNFGILEIPHTSKIAQNLQYTDKEVGVYFKNYPIYPNSTYKNISNAWKYVKENYLSRKSDKSSPDKIIFFNETLPSYQNCISMTNSITAPKQTNGYLYVVDCVAASGRNFYVKTSANTFVEEVIKEMGKMTLNATQEPGPGPGSWPAFNVSGSTMEQILVYDIYHGAKMSSEAERWATSVEKLEPLPRPDKYWFRDWYHTIYIKHGRTRVLKEFLSLVRNRKNKTQINLGEFVHFWSMAARTDLHESAKLYLGWSDAHQIEFVQARNEYPKHGYLCDKCDQLPEIQVKVSAGFWKDNLIPIVAGSSIFGVALLILAFGFKIYLDRKKIKSLKEQVRNLSDEEVDEFYKGNPNSVGTDDAHAPIQAMPFDMNYEIPRERLNINDKKVLGSGEFGIVKQGLLKGDPSCGRVTTTVAVKMVKPSMDVTYFKAHLSEIKIMAFLGQHENIASLLGTVTSNIKNGEVFVAMEFCAKGDLLRHLKDNGKNFIDLFRKRKAAGKTTRKQEVQANYTNAPEPEAQCTYTNASALVVKIEPSGDGESSLEPINKNSKISTLNLLQWSRQIANGMAFLKAKHVIHGDLAARNVLIGSNDVAKISDFGLSRQLVNYSNYKKSNTETPLPWRWLAIESLENMIFSPQSDVWAFGVTLWEIFTLGKIPYPGKTWNQEFIDGLTAGQLLPSPTLGNQEVYNIILSCMKTEPSERISLPEIISQLETVEVNLSYF